MRAALCYGGLNIPNEPGTADSPRGPKKRDDITYLHFVEELGARQTDPGVLDENGRVDFEKVWRSPPFNHGVERLRAGIDKGYTMALMCAEGDPLNCHRFYMITIALQREGFDVRHIMRDKTLKSTADLEKMLLHRYAAQLPQPDMFRPVVTRHDQLAAIYRLKNMKMGFSPEH